MARETLAILRSMPVRLGFGCRQRLQPRVQAALVTGNSVRVQHALLRTLVQGRNGGAELRLGGLHVALDKGLAKLTQDAADAAAVSAVHRGLSFSLTGALQRRYMICHSASLISVWLRYGQCRKNA